MFSYFTVAFVFFAFCWLHLPIIIDLFFIVHPHSLNYSVLLDQRYDELILSKVQHTMNFI